MIIVNHLQLPQSTDIYYPFAYEELLCRHVGEGALPSGIVHVWSHERAFVLGLRDSRLPYAAESMDSLASEGYSVMVRNSGGAAVPLDFGVVNVTLIQAGVQGSIDIYRDFKKMALFLQKTLEPLGVRFDTGQIEGSYCPGDYDLSMGGRKFCGIAQRRQLKALAVQAFVNAEGRSQDRTEVVNEFYKRAGGGKTMAGVLDIQSGVMGSITELHPAFPGTAVWLEQIKLAAEAEHAASLLIDPEQTDPLIKQMKSRYDPRFSPSRRS